MNIPIRLVYHFYNYNLNYDDEIIKIHFYCLKQFAKVFTEALFVIGVDDLENTESISKLESHICSLGFKGDIQFKIIKNDPLRREAETYINEILNKLDDLDGITFFAHSKGISDRKTEDLKYWIAALYYFNLNNMNEVISDLLEYNSKFFYGANPIKDTGEDRGSQGWNNENAWIFPGTMYWINTKRLNHYIKKNNISILTDNRWIAENITGDVCDITKKYVGYPAKYFGINFAYWYDNAIKYFHSMYSEEDIENFEEFYHTLLKNI